MDHAFHQLNGPVELAWRSADRRAAYPWGHPRHFLTISLPRVLTILKSYPTDYFHLFLELYINDYKLYLVFYV